MKCQCETPGFCPIRQIKMSKHHWKCCQGSSGLPEWKEQWYLEQLSSEKKEDGDSGPSIINKAINFGSAVLKHVGTGFKKVPLEVLNERLSICKSCENYIKDADSCKICGCNLSVKCSWCSSACPMNPPKWREYKQNSDTTN